MIQGKINEELINIPTNWGDVPFKKYIEFLNHETALDQASCLLGVPTTTLNKLNSEALGALFTALQFMHEPPNAYLEKDKEIDIGRESYGKLEMAKSLLLQHDKPKDALIGIAKIYTEIDFSEVATDEANPVCAFFFLHSKSSLSVIKD